MKQKQIDLVHERSTKNTHLYVCEGDNFITSLYIKKEALPKQAPEKIRVTVQFEDN